MLQEKEKKPEKRSGTTDGYVVRAGSDGHG
jgi:hypothetical protein